MGVEKIITPAEINKGMNAFAKNEERDGFYKTATFVVEHFWGQSSEMVDGLSVLLLTWNAAFYRFGKFDYDLLESTILGNLSLLTNFRKRDIATYNSVNDDKDIRNLFLDFLDALKITNNNGTSKSPVAVAKALHLCAPGFFPLWDKAIANEYKCNYSEDPEQKYIAFIEIMKNISDKLKGVTLPPTTTLLKAIDEFNYSKYTKHWI
ncbi:MAG: hypothetical protein R3F48_02835 [Candidatus Zixiibacteriota bacterium]